jgi:endonuclease-3
MIETPPARGRPTWKTDRVRQLERRLIEFRSGCRVTTLAQVQSSHRSAFHLLVSCVISLRTKDDVTHEASERLFSRAETPAELAELSLEEIADAIYPAGFYNTKARQLRDIARILLDRYDGAVPASEAALLALPGVGRKTANLVLGLSFGVPAICVDTHVHRISNRLGLVRTTSPEATERALQKVLPEELWIAFNDLLVTFGQNQCHPTSPRCSSCPVEDLCPRVGVGRHR